MTLFSFPLGNVYEFFSLLRRSGENEDYDLATQRKETSKMVVKATVKRSNIVVEFLRGMVNKYCSGLNPHQQH